MMDSAYLLEPNAVQSCFMSTLSGNHFTGQVANSDDLTGTLTSFVIDPCDPLNSCSTPEEQHDSFTSPDDAGYTSGVDLFSSSSIICSSNSANNHSPNDSTDDTYCFRSQFNSDTPPTLLAHDGQHNHQHHNRHSFIEQHHHHHHHQHSSQIDLTQHQADLLHHSQNLSANSDLINNNHQPLNHDHHSYPNSTTNTTTIAQACLAESPINDSVILGTSSSYSDIFNSSDFDFACDEVGICISSSNSSSDNYDDYLGAPERNICNLANDSPYANSYNDSYNNFVNTCFDTNFNLNNNNLYNNNFPADDPMTNERYPQQKRSVLMNLLIDGSDIGAGYRLLLENHS